MEQERMDQEHVAGVGGPIGSNTAWTFNRAAP
jgi:hypothetical protein